MTEKLKTFMDEAAQLDFATPDLDAILRDGDRTVRRHRLILGAAGVAAAALVVTGIVLTAGGDDPGSTVAGDPAPVDAVTWTVGQTLHTADGQTFDVGHDVTAFVRTSVGYAFLDDNDEVFSFIDGKVEDVGTVSHPYPQLYADDEGSLVGWVDGTEDGRRFVVHDLADDTTETFGDPSGMEQRSEFDSFVMYAIDGRTAYVRDSRGAIAYDVDTGSVRVIEDRPRDWFDIKGVEDGVIAFQTGLTSSDDIAGTVLGTSPTSGVELFPGWGGPARFSPDGRWVSLEGDEPAVYDAETGSQVTIDLDGRPFGTGYEWLDDDTLLFGASEKMVGPLQILSCEIPSGACTVVEEDLGMFEDIEGELALPLGVSTG
jgi:hypothetical protein